MIVSRLQGQKTSARGLFSAGCKCATSRRSLAFRPALPERGVKALRPGAMHHRPIPFLSRLVVHPPKADVTDVLERLRGRLERLRGRTSHLWEPLRPWPAELRRSPTLVDSTLVETGNSASRLRGVSVVARYRLVGWRTGSIGLIAPLPRHQF